MKKLMAFVLTLVCTLMFAACDLSLLTGLFGTGKSVAEVAKTENMVVITVNEAEDGVTLLSVMESLQAEGKLTYTYGVDGMVTAIEGKENAADWSACWMLYTSDAELANTDWGTVEYNGETCGSAIVGAGALEVIEGGIYIWSYQSF